MNRSALPRWLMLLPVLDTRFYLCTVDQEALKGSHNTSWVRSWMPTRSGQKCLIAADTTHTQYMTQRNQTGTNVDAFSLLASQAVLWRLLAEESH